MRLDKNMLTAQDMRELQAKNDALWNQFMNLLKSRAASGFSNIIFLNKHLSNNTSVFRSFALEHQKELEDLGFTVKQQSDIKFKPLKVDYTLPEVEELSGWVEVSWSEVDPDE